MDTYNPSPDVIEAMAKPPSLLEVSTKDLPPQLSVTPIMAKVTVSNRTKEKEILLNNPDDLPEAKSKKARVSNESKVEPALPNPPAENPVSEKVVIVEVIPKQPDVVKPPDQEVQQIQKVEQQIQQSSTKSPTENEAEKKQAKLLAMLERQQQEQKKMIEEQKQIIAELKEHREDDEKRSRETKAAAAANDVKIEEQKQDALNVLESHFNQLAEIKQDLQRDQQPVEPIDNPVKGSEVVRKNNTRKLRLDEPYALSRKGSEKLAKHNNEIDVNPIVKREIEPQMNETVEKIVERCMDPNGCPVEGDRGL
jgi:hypothetical protein